MEIRDLTPYGYPGYSIREDGWLISPKGRMIGGNANGQVRIKCSAGGTEWRSLKFLVATAFVPNPYNFLYVAFKDGCQDNLHYTNLEWTPMQHNAGRKRVAILQMLQLEIPPEQIVKEVGTTMAYVKAVAAARIRELKIMADVREIHKNRAD